MSRKPRITGFARFLIALVVIAPLAYLGASYANGEDGVENIKEMIGIGDGSSSTTSPRTSSSDDQAEEVADLEKEIKRLKKENRKLKDELNEREEEIEELRK